MTKFFNALFKMINGILFGNGKFEEVGYMRMVQQFFGESGLLGLFEDFFG